MRSRQSDPDYRLVRMLPDWRAVRGQLCGVLPQGMSVTPGEMGTRWAITQWAWVKPCPDGMAALHQAALAQDWQPLDEGAEDEVRWQRTLSDENLARQVVLGLYGLPVGDGWYVSVLALTFIPDEDN